MSLLLPHKVRSAIRFWALCGVAWLTACAVTQKPESKPNAAPIKWTRNDVVGLAMDLVDPTAIEWMEFTKDGFAPVTVGKQVGATTQVCGPLYYWKLVDGRLRIFDYQNKIYEELTLLSRGSFHIVAKRRSGETVTYKILRKPRG
jgi:hypothetical protein